MKDIIRSPEMYRRDRILDDWLEQIETGQLTVEECLAQHPELHDEMEPILRASRQLFAGEVTPLSAAKVRAIRGRVFDRVAPVAKKGAPSGGLWLAPAWSRLAGVVAVLVLVLGVGIAGAWRVSANSLPGSPLYPIKRGAETVQLVFTANSADSARLHLTFALRRLDEGLGLKQPERTMAEVAGELQRTEGALDQAQQLGAPVDWVAVAGLSARGERELAGVGRSTPETDRAAAAFRGLQQRARRQLGTGGSAESTAVPAPSASPTELRETPPPSRPAPSSDARPTEAPGPATTPPSASGAGHDQQGGSGYYGPSGAETPELAETSQPGATPRSTAGVEASPPATRASAGGVRGAWVTATRRPTAVPTTAPTVEPTPGPEQGQGNAPATPGGPTGGPPTSGGDGGSSGSGGGGSGGSSSNGGGGGGGGSRGGGKK